MLELRKYGTWRFSLLGRSPKVLQFLICIALGIVFAKFFFVFSPLFVLTAAVGLVSLIFSIAKPEIGILAIIVIVSSIIFEAVLPLIPIPFGSFHITDVLLIFLLIMIPFKLYSDEEYRLSPTPLDKPLLLFYLAALISAFIAIIHFKLDFNIVMRQFRPLTYYLIFFVVTNLIRDKRQIKFIIKGLFVIATIVGIAMIIQAIVGESIQLMPGRVEQAASLGQVYEATRILPPGQILIYVIFITAVCTVAFKKKPIMKSCYFYIILILGIGILLTYNRNYWASIAFSLSIFMIMISKRVKKRVIAWFVMVAILMSALSFTFLSIDGRPKEYLISIFDRFSSLFAGEKMFRSSTIDLRKIENEYALRQIAERPFFGIGLGNDYRPYTFGMEDWFYQYIHNGYLSIILKMGLVGLVPFLWFYIRFLHLGFLYWKKIEDVFLKSATIGFFLSGVGIMISALVSPLFIEWHAIVVLATMIGLTGAIIKINEREIKEKKQVEISSPTLM